MKKKIVKFFKYLKKHITGLNKTIMYVKRNTGNLYLYVLIDIIRCYIKYGSNYDEYRIYEFYIVKRGIESTYLTKHFHNKIKKYLYRKKLISFLNDRRDFYKKYDKYLNRDICYSKNLSFKQLEELISTKKTIVCKSSNTKENTTEVLELKDFRSPAFLLDSAKKNNLPILEEYLPQHKDIERINPNNINILSITTLRTDNEVDVVGAIMKFGVSRTFEYDYKKSNYVNCYVDLKTGIIKQRGRDRYGEIISKHPVTNEKLINFEVPLFEKAINTAIKCAKETDELLEVEWNFMISNKKVALISCNKWEDYTFVQIPEYLNNKVGLKPLYVDRLSKDI